MSTPPDGRQAAVVDLFDTRSPPPLPVHPAALTPDECAPWLRLMLTPGIGPVTALAVLARFGLPDRLFAVAGVGAGGGTDIDTNALRATLGPPLAAALLRHDDRREALVRRCVAWADPAARPPRHLVTLVDPRYPPRLLDLHDPPPVLFIIGDPACLVRPSVAIVGSRQASRAGVLHAGTFARSLSQRGWTVASGLAAGIDTAAHRGALAGRRGENTHRHGSGSPSAAQAPARSRAGDRQAGDPGVGTTFAVVGNGPDLVYPASNRALADHIAAQGAIVSELPLGAPPLAAHFPRRNRLIAALSQGVIVIEAAQRSGSLITARLAAELGRDVFALPGSIDAPQSRGCHALIKQGAKLVETLDDVLDELPPLAGSPATRPAVHSGAVAAAISGTANSRLTCSSAAGSRPPSCDSVAADLAAPNPDSFNPDSPDPEAFSALARHTESRDAEATDTGVLLDTLGWDPADVEALARAAGLSADRLGASLLLLEMRGQVERLADGRYRRMPGRTP